MPISQINISSDNVKVRDIALRTGHVELEVVPKTDNGSPAKQWKKRGLHFGLWDQELCIDVFELFLDFEPDTAIKEATERIWGWLGRKDVMIQISDGDSPHDFDVYVLGRDH